MAVFQTVACDYDSTLAHQGRVEPETMQVLRRARQAGKKLILITGRTLDDLREVFPEVSVFNLVVAENGAIMFAPERNWQENLCSEVSREFAGALTQREVPFSLGKCVLASHRPHETVIEKLINELGLDLAITLNRESVMVLPQGIDKASGLAAALKRLKIDASEVVGIGDAENDISFLRCCGFSVAVANAIESLKREVDYVTRQEEGAGVSEIIEQVIARELRKSTTETQRQRDAQRTRS